jgi:hypothetical protein
MSHHESTARDFTPGDLVDWGECKMRVAFDPAVIPEVDGPVEDCSIAFPDSADTEWAFQGFITDFQPADMPIEERAEADIVLKVTNEVSIGS